MEGSAETIGVEEAREALAAAENRPQAVDVRGREEWLDGHVPGAVHLPSEELESQLDGLSKDERVIVIGSKDDPGTGVVSKLSEQGFDAVAIEGGMEAWKDANFTLQPSEDPDLEDSGPDEEPAPAG